MGMIIMILMMVLMVMMSRKSPVHVGGISARLERNMGTIKSNVDRYG